jgi:hypothetical protein
VCPYPLDGVETPHVVTQSSCGDQLGGKRGAFVEQLATLEAGVKLAIVRLKRFLWRRAWRDAGTEGLRSAGPVSRPKLSEALFTVLEQELA